MKLPGPDHPITIEPHPQRLKISRDGVVLVDTTKALILKESSYPPVFYVPRHDAVMTLLTPTSRRSHCPYKGEASYFSIAAGGEVLDNAVWSYPEPYPAMAEIAGHLAFYPDKVTFESD